ncbi:flagellar motor protein MotB [Variovorax boronicumulans]|nr:hypothetical protein [Variovorax boronicumulans]MDQ0086115.1 flagellar motor protein MotB [Variovorax boronicumulans]
MEQIALPVGAISIPIAGNSSDANRARNQRVEIYMGERPRS